MPDDQHPGRALTDALERQRFFVVLAVGLNATGGVKTCAQFAAIRAMTPEQFQAFLRATVECLTQIRIRPMDDLELL